MNAIKCTIKPTLFFYIALFGLKVINFFSNKKGYAAYESFFNAVNNKPDLFIKIKRT